MPELPDPRSVSADALNLWRLLAVRAAAQYGVSGNTMSQWVSLYREQGEAGLAVQPQGRPQGSGRALSREQELQIRHLILDSMPCDHDSPSATWTRQAVTELIAKRMGIDLTLQGVGQYLRRWGLTPQKPARQTRKQNAEEVREFVEQTRSKVKEQAEGKDMVLSISRPNESREAHHTSVFVSD